ncbi:MAG: DsbE family thiol:disulfide interchange protein [Alphaproteobacteria bacterium]|nr:DsbE family thiol:disulfide interchange protein [Alphaproteobacteria bacterium]
MGRAIYIIPVAVAVILATVFLWALDPERDPSQVPSPLIDRPVPAFRMPTLEGQGDVTQAIFAGRVSVFNVFASWCIPCRAEHPLLMEIARAGKAQVIGLNYKDKPEDAKAWLKRLGNPYAKIGTDPKGRSAIDWGVYGVPETFIIDKAGRIRYKHVGPIMPHHLADTIKPLIERLAQ